MKVNSLMRMAAVAAIASLGNALGVSIVMNGYRPGTNEPSATTSHYTSQDTYASGPGWSAAHVKRMATKRRNRARNKVAHRKVRS